MKSGNLNFLEPSGPLQACNGTALPSYVTFLFRGFGCKTPLVGWTNGGRGRPSWWSSGNEPRVALKRRVKAKYRHWPSTPRVLKMYLCSARGSGCCQWVPETRGQSSDALRTREFTQWRPGIRQHDHSFHSACISGYRRNGIEICVVLWCNAPHTASLLRTFRNYLSVASLQVNNFRRSKSKGNEEL